MRATFWRRVISWGQFAAWLLPLSAVAQGARISVPPIPANAKWQQECTSCHIGYAPRLLPAASWRKVMAGLDKHFGADASMTPVDTEEITAYLVKFGSNRWSGAATPLRITETAGFKRQHGGSELPVGVWARPSVKSASNCQVCHSGADKGDFNEDAVKIPN